MPLELPPPVLVEPSVVVVVPVPDPVVGPEPLAELELPMLVELVLTGATALAIR